MTAKTMEKNPARVRGGQARMQQLRDELARQGTTLAAYQTALYYQTIEKHPDFHQIGGRAGYAACAAKYGEAFARARVQAARERQRHHRLDHPTPGEAAVRTVLTRTGFTILRFCDRFDYRIWCVDPLEWSLGPFDALAEGSVGTYDCDILLPVQQLAIEVHGGVHVLTGDHDERRRAFLEAQGLTVVVLTEAEALDTDRTLQILYPFITFPMHR